MAKAIILDMDGLLIDSEPLWREAEIKIFGKVGVPLTEKRCLETMGLRVDEVVDYWFLRYPWSDPSKSEVASRILTELISLIEERGEAMAGVDNIFSIIKEGGYKSAIASSSTMRTINAVMRKLDIDKNLDIIHSAEDEPYGKPHPGVYITTAKKLGVDPAECVAFEDSVNGLLAAKAAKMRCIAVPDRLARDNKEFGIADVIVDSLEEVTKEMIMELGS